MGRAIAKRKSKIHRTLYRSYDIKGTPGIRPAFKKYSKYKETGAGNS